jgi:class 3 adenylate cyclase
MKDTRQWLESLGLGQYADAFEENDIDSDLLGELTDEFLQAVGVTSVGHRMKIIKAVRDHAPSYRATSIANADESIAASESKGEAERRQLTVMFCDLVDSTALSRRLDPEDLRSLIANYQQTCQQAVTEFDGFVARYMGDGVLAYFGYPKSHEDDAERALRSALAIVVGVHELNEALDTDIDLELSVRIGIATGLVVVGDLIGEGASRESPVLGDTPNIAARLQSLAQSGSVLIAESTHRLIGQLFECRALGGHTVKGIPEPVNVWEVIEISQVESRFEAARKSKPLPLVGREEELNLLLNRWRHIADRDGRVVLISGEAGIGKSRLTEAIRERIAPTTHTRIRYQCSPHHMNSALYPVISQLGRAAGISRQDEPARKLEKLRDLLRQATPDVDDVLPLIADLMSIPAEGLYVEPRLDSQQQKELTLGAIIRLLESLASTDRVLCVFEDVHWVDPSTLELLERIVERCEFLSMLVLVTCRPDFSAPWTGQAHTSLVSLSRMTQPQARVIAQQIAEHTTLDQTLLDDIVAKTDGIPLFVEELTRAVLDSDDGARVDDTSVSHARFESIGIPATLQDSLMSRLDKLSVGKPIAQMASALGRDFSYEIIAAVAQQENEKVEAALDELTRSGLVLRRGTGRNASYMFKHALVQDAAYQSMLRSARCELHGRIALVLIEQFSEIQETAPEIVARHCSEAGLVNQATQYWQQAGERAAARAAHSEAIEHYSKGLALVSEVEAERTRNSLRVAFNLGLPLPASKSTPRSSPMCITYGAIFTSPLAASTNV